MHHTWTCSASICIICVGRLAEDLESMSGEVIRSVISTDLGTASLTPFFFSAQESLSWHHSCSYFCSHRAHSCYPVKTLKCYHVNWVCRSICDLYRVKRRLHTEYKATNLSMVSFFSVIRVTVKDEFIDLEYTPTFTMTAIFYLRNMWNLSEIILSSSSLSVNAKVYEQISIILKSL